MSPLLNRPEEAVAVVEHSVVKVPMWGSDRADHGGNVLDRLIGQAKDRPDLGNLGIVTERHAGKHAEFGFQRREQALIDRGVHQIADQRRIPAQSIGKGIVFQALFLEIERKGGSGEAHVERIGSGRPLSFFG